MHPHGDRRGARQPERFDPRGAARLDDPARIEYLPLAEVLALLDAPRRSTLVDLGTGTGFYALAVARARPDLTVLAVDEQPAMLDLLRARLSREPLPNLRPVLAGAEDLAGRAERLLAVNVLHELGDAALDGAKALLAPGGRAVFVDWNAGVERPVGPPKDHVYGLDEAVRRVEGRGYAVAARRLLRYQYALVCSAG